MKKIKSFIFILFTSILVANCSGVREGLQGKKLGEGEEFLIQKKNPLVLPPDFDTLPLPKNVYNEENNSLEIEGDIEKLLKKNSGKKKSDTMENNSTSLEESIIKKIK